MRTHKPSHVPRISAIILRLTFLTVLAVTLNCCYSTQALTVSPSHIAFSLREAAERSHLGEAGDELMLLGGITRFVGAVYDAKTSDIVLLGLRAPGLPPARLNDFIVALRAKIKYHEIPTVSIDPTKDTAITRKQAVNFTGHLEDTSFGFDLLQCDILLKRYSLDQLSPVSNVPSYTTLIDNTLHKQLASDISWLKQSDGQAAVQKHQGARVQSQNSCNARFWFVGRNDYNVKCEHNDNAPEISCIIDLPIILKAEIFLLKTDNASSTLSSDNSVISHNEIYSNSAIQFADSWTRNFYTMCNSFPDLKCLKTFYDFVALAELVHRINGNVAQQVYLDYYLNEYQVPVMATQDEYPLEELYGIAQLKDGGERILHLSGGIELAPGVELLNDGSILGLRDIVLDARPSAKALSWRVPLAGWQMPNAAGLLLDGAGIQAGDAATPRGSDQQALRTSAVKGSYFHVDDVVLAPSNAADTKNHSRLPVFNGFNPVTSAPPFGGCSMEMKVTAKSFVPETTGKLAHMRDEAAEMNSDGELSHTIGENK